MDSAVEKEFQRSVLCSSNVGPPVLLMVAFAVGVLLSIKEVKNAEEMWKFITAL